MAKSTLSSPLQPEIQSVANELGAAMDAALPWKRFRGIRNKLWMRLWQIGGAYQTSEAAIVSDFTLGWEEEEEGERWRTWLARDITKREEDSTVRLLADTVVLDLAKGYQGAYAYRSRNSREVAVYNQSKFGLKLKEDLGTPPEATMERIQELGGWVTKIAEASLQSKLIEDVPRLIPTKLLRLHQ